MKSYRVILKTEDVYEAEDRRQAIVRFCIDHNLPTDLEDVYFDVEELDF